MAADTLPVEPEQRKGFFDKVMTTTPVLLTVIATFLVGQSTSEMTQAQYYRSLASQNQSKAGDQWALFQAKRTRGQTHEAAATLLAAQSRSFFRHDTFVEVAHEMLNHLKLREARCRETAEALKKEVEALLLTKSIKPAEREKTEEQFCGECLRQAEEFKKLVPAARKALDCAKSLSSTSGRGDAALAALLEPRKRKKSAIPNGSGEVVAASDPDDNTKSADLVTSIVRAITQKKPEKEIAKGVLKIGDESLEKAIADSDRRAAEINRKGKEIEKVLEKFDELLDQITQLAREPQMLDIAKNAWELRGDYMAARLAYTARRYEDDARSNQESAYLYEVKVYLNSARSDKHLFRSKMFMFAMLAAQAGVAISTLALAVKRKSPFWLLATLIGLVGIALGVYVYLDLPMPTF